MIKSANCSPGYFDLFAALYQNHTEILQSFENTVFSTPIRVIIRNTRNYRHHLSNQTPINDLLPEDRIQLERGDIPYFLKKCEDDRLYWISSESGNESVVAEVGSFKMDILKR